MTASYLFKLRFTLLPLCAMLSLAPASTASAGQMAGPPASLVSLADPEGWFASVAYINSDRQVRFGDTVTDVDFNRVIAATGVTVLPFLDLRVEAGWVTADMGVAEGEGGLEWGVGARAAIWEYIIEGTPALPRRRALRVEADVAYHAGRSNFETDFEWTALTVSPLLRYTHDRTTEAVWHHRHATGLAAYAGFQYSDCKLGTEHSIANVRSVSDPHGRPVILLKRADGSDFLLRIPPKGMGIADVQFEPS